MTAQRAGTPINATFDHTMQARVIRQVPLLYAAGADSRTDRPAHVRAGSGLAWVGDRLAVVQDDANFVALVDVESGHCDSVTLPAGHGGKRQFDDARGNKRYKHDFESLLAIGDGASQLIAFGSGSSPRREDVLVISGAGGTSPVVRVIPAPAFYEGLRSCREFAGSELNVEGAALVGENIRLFNRGNGAPRAGLVPVDATCDIGWRELLAHIQNPSQNAAPKPKNVVQFLLGDIDGVRLSFTDAVPVRGEMFYVAAAEDSPDAVQDGVVAGSAVGVISNRDGRTVARWTHLRTADGAIARVKVEGMATGRNAGQLFVVVDRDEHDQPSELLELEVSGFEFG